jgi:hypothetical protein
MVFYGLPHQAIIIALYEGIKLAILMVSYGGTDKAFIIALYEGI